MSGLELLDLIRDHLDDFDLEPGEVRPSRLQAMSAEVELRYLLKALGRLTR